MAGDWIKVEIATAQKPEVLHMAELLGVSRRECMGILVDFWAWLDANARHEVVPNLSRKSLDSVLNCPGIAAALEVVGWIKWDDVGVSACIANFEKHNSQSAKGRAHDQKRKADQRSSTVPEMSQENRDKTGTREEKRREEITTKSKAIARVPLAEPTEDHRALARSLGLNCETEFQKYRDHFDATGKHHKNEAAGFRKWLRKAPEFVPKTLPADRRTAAAAAMYGSAERPRQEIDVTPTEVKRVA